MKIVYFSKLTYLNFDQSTVKNSCVHLISLLSVQSTGKNRTNKNFNLPVPLSIYGGMHQHNKDWVILNLYSHISRLVATRDCSILLNQVYVFNPQTHWRPLALELCDGNGNGDGDGNTMMGEGLGIVLHIIQFLFPGSLYLPAVRVTGTLGRHLGIIDKL